MLKRLLRSATYRLRYYSAHAFRTAKVAAHAAAARAKTTPAKHGLFIDCGSNLGQGFTYFSRFYRPSRYDYVMVEPNPNCLPTLRKAAAKRVPHGRVEIINKAASDRAGTVTFYGLAANEGGKTSEGGSILPTHNTKFYKPSAKGSLKVKTFPLADLIQGKAKTYKHIVLKLDVEGAEYAIIPHLLKSGAAKKLGHLYIEFHADYVDEKLRAKRLAEETSLLRQLKRAGVPYTLWV